MRSLIIFSFLICVCACGDQSENPKDSTLTRIKVRVIRDSTRAPIEGIKVFASDETAAHQMGLIAPEPRTTYDDRLEDYLRKAGRLKFTNEDGECTFDVPKEHFEKGLTLGAKSERHLGVAITQFEKTVDGFFIIRAKKIHFVKQVVEVRDREGRPVIGATVSLLRVDSETGPKTNRWHLITQAVSQGPEGRATLNWAEEKIDAGTKFIINVDGAFRKLVFVRIDPSDLGKKVISLTTPSVGRIKIRIVDQKEAPPVMPTRVRAFVKPRDVEESIIKNPRYLDTEGPLRSLECRCYDNILEVFPVEKGQQIVIVLLKVMWHRFQSETFFVAGPSAEQRLSEATFEVPPVPVVSFKVEDHQGNPMIESTLSYRIKDETPFGPYCQGDVTTDKSGRASIQIYDLLPNIGPKRPLHLSFKNADGKLKLQTSYKGKALLKLGTNDLGTIKLEEVEK